MMDQFPAKIEDVYTATMERIERQSEHLSKIAWTVLLWVTFARRPLTVTELQHAVSYVHSDTLKPDHEALIAETLLISTCCGLVTVDDKSRMVRLVRM